MAVNDIIKEADYNSIRNKLVNVMGAGSVDYGWGQTSKIQSSAVSVGSSVSINDWGKLRYDIINAWIHCFGTTPITAQVAEGYSVRYSNTFVPDIGPSPSTPSNTDSPVTQYNSMVDLIIANRFAIGSGQSTDTTDVNTSRSWSIPGGTSWKSSISAEIKVEFGSATEARYFFNSGGTVRITSSRTATTANAQNNAWTTLLSTAGTKSFGGNTPTAGLGTMNGTNWYRTTSTDQVWSTSTSSTPYGSNNYKIFSRCDVASNSTGTAKIGYFIVQFNDGYIDPDTSAGRSETLNPPGDNVDGKFEIVVDCLYPSGILVPTGTGNFTITPPTVTFSQAITGS